MNILFLCTGNSCRSIIAEALLKSMAPAGITSQSAGSHPTGQVNPRALATLEKAGISTKGYSSKSWDSLPIAPDVVITLCAEAAGETCPAYLTKAGKVVRSHWGMPDPAKAEGDDLAITAAFSETLAVLKKRITLLLTALEKSPDMSAEALQMLLDDIATQ